MKNSATFPEKGIVRRRRASPHNLIFQTPFRALSESLGRIVVAANYELGSHGEFLSGETESFLSHIERNTFNLDQDATRSYGRHETFGVTFTFTHSSFSWLSCYWFVRENFDPNFTTTRLM